MHSQAAAAAESMVLGEMSTNGGRNKFPVNQAKKIGKVEENFVVNDMTVYDTINK